MKKFFTLMAVVAVACTLVSCKGGKPTHDGTILAPDQIDTSKDITITFYHAMGAANQAVIQTIADNFSEEMKEKYGVNVKVEQTSQGDYTTLRKTIASAIAAGDQPTIAQTYPDHVSLYLEGEAVRSLDAYLTSTDYGMEGTEENCYGFIKSFWDEGRIYDSAKTLYSIPFNKSTEVLYYNIELFQKYGWTIPKTWEEVLDICEKWKQTTEYQTLKNKGTATAGIGIDSEANLFITLIQQFGATYTYLDSKDVGHYAFYEDEANKAKSEQAMNWLLDNFKAGNVVSTTYFGTNYCSDAFKAGQCPMTIGSSAGTSYNVVSDGSFTTGISTYPQFANAKEEEKYVIQQGTNVTLFKCNDAQEELFGWLFIKYLTNYESSLYWTLNTSYFPTRTDVEACKEYQDYVSQMVYDETGAGQKIYNPTKEVCIVGLSQSKYFYTSVAFPGSSKCRDEVEIVIQEILYNPTDYTVKKALEDAIKALKNN